MKIHLIVAIIISSAIIPASSQELVDLKESYKLQEQVNQLRIFRRDLKYDTTKQAIVDNFAMTILVRHYRHSGYGCGEVITKSPTIENIMVMWTLSDDHRKALRGPYKSMCGRIVKTIKNGEVKYFGVIQLY